MIRAPAWVDTFVYLVLTPELLPFNNWFPFLPPTPEPNSPNATGSSTECWEEI